jgi:hypothetical protein
MICVSVKETFPGKSNVDTFLELFINSWYSHILVTLVIHDCGAHACTCARLQYASVHM